LCLSEPPTLLFVVLDGSLNLVPDLRVYVVSVKFVSNTGLQVGEGSHTVAPRLSVLRLAVERSIAVLVVFTDRSA